MYRCCGCEGIVENINSQCFCGKTIIDHKGRAVGEKFTKISGQPIYGRTKVRTCPHCGWTGLVIPRIGVGCPDHGIWYKNNKEINVKPMKVIDEEIDDTTSNKKHKRSERRDFRRRGTPHGKKNCYR